MPFAGVNDQHAEAAGGVEHLPARIDRGLQPGNVIAQCFAEASRLEEIALHVDDDKSGALKINRQWRRFGL